MLERIDVSVGRKTLPEIRNGVDKYLKIMGDLHKRDVSNDTEFQKTFNGFYRMRQRTKEFYQAYFGYMETNKSSEIAFEDVLTFLYQQASRIEPSFSSKLLATVNPEMPVWDVNVLSNLSIQPPRYYHKNRLEATVNTYLVLELWYTKYLTTQNARDVINAFDAVYPNTNITPTKKIDLSLWSLGEKK